jgi:four helix bundle protein
MIEDSEQYRHAGGASDSVQIVEQTALILLRCSRMSEEAERLKARSMKFAVAVCKLLRSLHRDEPGPTVRRQLAKSSTSVAFNYRAACRGRSHAEFTAKMGTVCEESDETLGWLEFIDEARLMASPVPTPLMREARELVAIFSATYGTARANQQSA